METQTLALDAFNPVPYNPRQTLKPTDPEWQAIKASMDEFGQVLNLVGNRRTGNLVSGHQRINIMRHDGKDTAVFTIVDLDLAAEKRLNLVLNKVSGRWDQVKLGDLLGELRAQSLDLHALGFTPIELQKVLGAQKKRLARSLESVPATPAIASTATGDLYELRGAMGNWHRLLCGDVRDPDNAKRLMQGHKAGLVFTDPPYGVDYDNAGRAEGRRPLGKIDGDALTGHAFTDLLVKAFTEAHRHSIAKAALYTFYAQTEHTTYLQALTTAGWRSKQQLIWAKTHFALGRCDYHYAHEPIFYAEKQDGKSEWFGPRNESTVLEMPEAELKKLSKEALLAMITGIREASSLWIERRQAGTEYEHPTQKPTSLAKRALLNSTLPGGAVLDLCAGSGSTMVAAEAEDRRSFNLEVKPHFCDVIVRRFLETFEGATATRNGEPFTV